MNNLILILSFLFGVALLGAGLMFKLISAITASHGGDVLERLFGTLVSSIIGSIGIAFMIPAILAKVQV